MNNDSILQAIITHLMENPENSNILNICEKIHTKILSSNKNYTSIIEILEEIANDELAQLCRLNATTYDENVKQEIKTSMLNKLCYYYLGDEESGSFFEKTETLNSFLDNKDQEYYIWQHKKTSCKACRELSKRIYTIDEIPNRPHPNCRCSIFSVSDILLKNPDYMALYLTQSQTDPKAFESMLDNLQFFLDMVGLIEGVGTIADAANVIIYLARKDYVNAGLSGFKILPLASILVVGGKITARVVKATSKADDVVDLAKGINKTVDVFEGAGKTFRDALLNSASNQMLKNAIDQIYRPGATIGDGGLADAIRHQLLTGNLVGGKDHLIKGAERVKNLENIIKKESLNSNDLELAQKLLDDLKNALGGK